MAGASPATTMIRVRRLAKAYHGSGTPCGCHARSWVPGRYHARLYYQCSAPAKPLNVVAPLAGARFGRGCYARLVSCAIAGALPGRCSAPAKPLNVVAPLAGARFGRGCHARRVPGSVVGAMPGWCRARLPVPWPGCRCPAPAKSLNVVAPLAGARFGYPDKYVNTNQYRARSLYRKST